MVYTHGNVLLCPGAIDFQVRRVDNTKNSMRIDGNVVNNISISKGIGSRRQLTMHWAVVELDVFFVFFISLPPYNIFLRKSSMR